VKRSFKLLVFLVICLFALVSGVDATLDHYSRCISQNSYTLYNERGEVVASFMGDPAAFPGEAHPAPSLARTLHRT
jgi:hypothetical protein